MKSSLRLVRIAGIDIGIHYTWVFIFVLLSVSLAVGFFPQLYPGWDRVTYWITGVVAALLLFVSVLLHELAHSLVAKARGIPVHSITLFILGGVSNLEEEPEKPKVELVMAIVGPLASIALAGICWGLLQLVEDRQSPLAGMLTYLALINAILAAFNLLPGFPLDGGRVLRSIIWEKTGSLVRATNIAATVGRFMGWGFIAFGLFQILAGNLGGLWLAFIGWFLSSAADASRREITAREQLSGVRVKEVMATSPTTISPDTTVAELISNTFRRQLSRAVPVCQNDQVMGIVTVTDVKELPREKWEETPVREIMIREPLHSVSPEDDLNTALRIITKHDVNQVLVMDGTRCAGLVTRADILNYLQLSQELDLKETKGKDV
ncbi:MAG TPA: site-2 protease family protein [Chloroflexi bacterium]|nr:site-2 protease family protein [Chloroflexota bacterium]